MKWLAKVMSMALTLLLIITSLSSLNVFAEDNSITVSCANGNATVIEKGTSMKMTAGGVTQGKAVSWSVTDTNGAPTALASITAISSTAAILTASSNGYGKIKITATQSDGSGKKGEQIIAVTNENIITVDDTDSAVKYFSAGSGEAWSQSSNSSYLQGTGKSIVPPEDGSYSIENPAYAEFSFTGTGIQWIGETNYSCGLADIYLDGEKVSTVDPFIAPSIISQFINFSKEGLPNGQHTIKVVATGLKNSSSTVYPGTKVLIDAFRYITAAPEEVDKTALTAKIAEAQGLSQNIYTAESWAALQTALSAAIVVNTDADATQTEVDAALAGLQAAIDGLVRKGPAVSITANDSVHHGEEFIVTLGLVNLNQTVHAEDITLNYDTSLFEYIKTEAASNDIMVPQPEPPTSGVLRILAGNNGGISGDVAILKVTFKVKEAAATTSGIIAVSSAKLGIAPEGIVIEAGVSSKTITVGPVDKSVLSNTIVTAKALYDSAVVGGQPGQYPAAAKEAFNTAIGTAQAVLDKASATQTEVNDAVIALNAAVDVFKNSVIKPASGDVNGDGKIDVGDLSFVAYYYGENSSSSNWEKAKKYDVNNDGIIDIFDLALVASEM